MFLHGGLLHLAGNMLFLWVFGSNIEDRTRPLGYLLVYVERGVVATAAHVELHRTAPCRWWARRNRSPRPWAPTSCCSPDVSILTVISIVIGLLQRIPAKRLPTFWFISQFFIGPNSGVA
jgi:membrane associated rhomboid family serine protease